MCYCGEIWAHPRVNGWEVLDIGRKSPNVCLYTVVNKLSDFSSMYTKHHRKRIGNEPDRHSIAAWYGFDTFELRRGTRYVEPRQFRQKAVHIQIVASTQQQRISVRRKTITWQVDNESKAWWQANRILVVSWVNPILTVYTRVSTFDWFFDPGVPYLVYGSTCSCKSRIGASGIYPFLVQHCESA